jgi:hypothetical protein
MRNSWLRRIALPLLVALLGALTTNPTHAGPFEMGEIESDTQAWSMVILQGNITSHVRGFLEIQPRFAEDASTLDKFIVRPALVYTLNKEFSLWFGYAGIQSYLPEESIEHRTWQQIQHEKNFGGVILINRTRFEQRFLPGEEDTSHRLRHMVRAVLPVNDDRTWAVVFADEVFVNLNSVGSLESGFDQNRAFVGLNHAINSHLRVEFGYMNQFTDKMEPALDRLSHNFLVQLIVNF